MKSVFWLFLSLFYCLYVSATEPGEFCDPGTQKSELISDWSDVGEKHCLEVQCLKEGETIQRSRCFKSGTHANTIEVYFRDIIRGEELYAEKSFFKEVVLVPGVTCFDECRPKEEMVLGLWRSTKKGLERDSCKRCFQNRGDEPQEEPYYLEKAQKWLYPGMRCYHRCQFIKGEFSQQRPYPLECKKCVGMDGHEALEFEYLITKDGTCYEYDFENKKIPVDEIVCQKYSRVISTYYKKGSEYSLRVLLWKEDPECLEVDEKTHGSMFTKTVESSLCLEESVDDSSRNRSKDNDTNEVKKSRQSSKAIKE